MSSRKSESAIASENVAKAPSKLGEMMEVI
jgi:hypothetical protein